jgi:protein-disulfide isomerase
LPTEQRTASWLTLGLFVIQTALLGLVVLRLRGVERELAGLRQSLAAGALQARTAPVPIEPGDGPSQGPADAPVTIVEFSDFQCPFCSRLYPTVEQVKSTYGDKVHLVFRQFPLNFHQFAQKAAEASLCADEQGKFWEMHNAMFSKQDELAVDKLKEKAAGMGLKADQFNACLDGGKYAPKVAEDVKAGSEAGVSGTPALFINGRFISGAVPYADIAKVIDDELQRKGAK